MPDSRARDPMPRDWGDAFGALPLEAPPHDGWQRLAAALPAASVPARPSRWRRPAIAAMAAAVALAAILPAWRQSDPADTGDASPMQTTPRSVARADDPNTVTESVPSITAPIAVIQAPIREDVPAPPSTRRLPRTAPAATVERHQTVRDRVASLQAESARLEALVATSEQAHIINAGVQVVSGELAASIGTIDEALASGNRGADSTESLWTQRNALLGEMLLLQLRQRQIASEQISPFQIAQIN